MKKRFISIGVLFLLALFTALSGCDTIANVFGTGEKEISVDTSLGALTVSAGSLSQTFDAAVTEYAVDVPNSMSAFTIAATCADPDASLVFSQPQPMNLDVGMNTSTITVSAPEQESKTYTIVVYRSAFANIGYVSNDSDIFKRVLNDVVVAEATARSIPLVEITASTQAEQVVAMQTLIEQKVSAIALMPLTNDVVYWEDILIEAENAEIPVVFLYSYLGDTVFPVTQIKSNDQAMAAAVAEWFHTKVEGSASIIALEGINDHPATIDRKAGFYDAIAADWTIIESLTANFSDTVAYDEMAALLASDPQPTFEMVFAHNDNMAFGAIDALKDAGEIVGTDPGEILVGSIDGTKNALQSVLDGELACTVEHGVGSAAPLMFDALEAYYSASATPIPSLIDTIHIVYDAETIPSQAWIDALP